MPKKQQSKQKQQTAITSTALPLLKKPLEQKGKDIKVPGAYWEGRMSAEDRFLRKILM